VSTHPNGANADLILKKKETRKKEYFLCLFSPTNNCTKKKIPGD